MANTSHQKDLSLKWLEIFKICAERGSLQAASEVTGLSVSTISHHLRSLENHLGTELLDHSRRPMILTPKGTAFLRNIEDALLAIRRATAEASAGSSADSSYLQVGCIEDFDSDVMPELAVHLVTALPRCDLNFHTDTSHALLEMLQSRRLDLGIATSPASAMRGLVERPLLRDPYVAILPADVRGSLTSIAAGTSSLPLLRFSDNLIVARQIESQLRRLGIDSPNGFECSNNQTLMAMVASGAGWAISTPLHYQRARRFHRQIKMHSFPGKRFSRTVSILATSDCSRSVVDLIDQKFRNLAQKHTIAPLHETEPWLKEDFRLLEGTF